MSWNNENTEWDDDTPNNDDEWLMSWNIAMKAAVEASKRCKTIAETVKVVQAMDGLLYTRTNRDNHKLERDKYL